MSYRKAFGPQRPMSPTVKARNVAESIRAHGLMLTPATWARYGLEHNQAQQGLVRDALDTYDALSGGDAHDVAAHGGLRKSAMGPSGRAR